MTTTQDVAKSLVSKLGGDPNNAAIVRATQVWIASESGSVIYGNNPLNMRPGNEASKPIGTDASGFSVFPTLDAGVTATAQRLQANDYRGYAPIAAAIKSNSVTGFYSALVASKWDSSHYGGNITKLMSRYNSGSSYNSSLSFKSRAGSPAPVLPGHEAGPPASGGLTDTQNPYGLSFPTGKIMTQADANSILAAMLADHSPNGLGSDVSGIATQVIRAELNTAVGHPITADLFKQMQGDILNASKTSAGINPLNGLPDLTLQLGKLGGFAAALVLIALGVWLYARGTAQHVIQGA